MKKQTIRLNESQLHKLIKESVKNVLHNNQSTISDEQKKNHENELSWLYNDLTPYPENNKYDIDQAYHGEIGNRSQYAPEDTDAQYAYEHPGELGMAAQGALDYMTGDDRPTRWARHEKFKSINESQLHKLIKESIKKELKENDVNNNEQKLEGRDLALALYQWMLSDDGIVEEFGHYGLTRKDIKDCAGWAVRSGKFQDAVNYEYDETDEYAYPATATVGGYTFNYWYFREDCIDNFID